VRIHSIAADDILISDKRQRRTFSAESIIELASSIEKNRLVHPVAVRKDESDNFVLIAGERRIRAMHYIWDLFGGQVRCGDFTFEKGQVPCILHSEMDPIQAWEMELEENIRRVDLSWQEKAEATSALMQLRSEQALREGERAPSVESISEEIYGNTSSADTTRKQLLVVPHLLDPDVQKCATVKDAYKLLKRKEEIARSAELARSVGVTFTSAVHTLRHGDCFEIMADLEKESFDVILTDPPYGIDADKFNDSGGMAAGGHFYDDSWTTWNVLARKLAAESFRLAKPTAHCYIFCDVDNFVLLKNFMTEANWNVFRTPLIWVNPQAARAPWPESGPQRKYQIILYAKKGDRPVTRLYGDVLTYSNDENLNHPAQKPVALYSDLLLRSALPGDTVLDPFGGTGPIIPACHAAKCRATYIEKDDAAYGIAIARLKELET
jgi:site-specific DNA-methyltransferase (adenine-specific)